VCPHLNFDKDKRLADTGQISLIRMSECVCRVERPTRHTWVISEIRRRKSTLTRSTCKNVRPRALGPYLTHLLQGENKSTHIIRCHQEHKQ